MFIITKKGNQLINIKKIFFSSIFVSISLGLIGCASFQKNKTEYEKAFECAQILEDASIPSQSLFQVNKYCLLIEQPTLTYVYTPSGVQIVKNNSFFQGEESRLCRQIITQQSYANSFKNDNRKYSSLLINQFLPTQIRPFTYETALKVYNKSFEDGLKQCQSLSSLHKSSDFQKKLKQISDHIGFLTKERESQTKGLKYQAKLKRLKQIGKSKWQLTVNIAIVNNGTSDYIYVTDCDESTPYEIYPNYYHINKTECSRSYLNRNRIPPQGVYRHQLILELASSKRPSGQTFSIYFGAAPSVKISSIKIPEKQN